MLNIEEIINNENQKECNIVLRLRHCETELSSTRQSK